MEDDQPTAAEAPKPETLSREQLVALANSSAERVEIDAQTLRDLCNQHPDHPVFSASCKAWETGTKPLTIGRVTLRELLR